MKRNKETLLVNNMENLDIVLLNNTDHLISFEIKGLDKRVVIESLRNDLYFGDTWKVIISDIETGYIEIGDHTNICYGTSQDIIDYLQVEAKEDYEFGDTIKNWKYTFIKAIIQETFDGKISVEIK